eukprot:3425503-Heterocapsa_arctica.AAC.1
MFSAPVGQWQEQNQGEARMDTERRQEMGVSPSRQEEQAWEWQPGHEDLTLEEEANPGGVQE